MNTLDQRAFLAGYLWAMARNLAEGKPPRIDEDASVLRAASRLLAADAGVRLPDPETERGPLAPTREPYARATMIRERHSRRAPEAAAMSQQWPDPNDPNTPHPQPIQTPPGETPAAPHTPESPRETPEPRDTPTSD